MTELSDAAEFRSGTPNAVTTILLGTTREWFASALEAVLHTEGFSVVRTGSAEELLDAVRDRSAELVMMDGSLPEVQVSQLCARLVQGPLPAHVPLVVYTDSYSGDGIHAEALDAGAWEILSEPIRSKVLVSAFRRLVDLSARIRARSTERRPLWDEETGLFTENGLLRVLPQLQALASREDVRMSCVVVGPTQVGRGEVLQRQRMATADLCALNIRTSDVCGWLGEGELAIIAFDTPAEGAMMLAERLNELAAGRANVRKESRTLSAGIVELVTGASGPDERGREPRERDTAGTRRDERLGAARMALREARERGGGIRVAEVA